LAQPRVGTDGDVVTHVLLYFRLTILVVATLWHQAKIYGVGVFGVESYRLFCLGDLSFDPHDKNLQAFRRWQLKNRKPQQSAN